MSSLSSFGIRGLQRLGIDLGEVELHRHALVHALGCLVGGGFGEPVPVADIVTYYVPRPDAWSP